MSGKVSKGAFGTSDRWEEARIVCNLEDAGATPWSNRLTVTQLLNGSAPRVGHDQGDPCDETGPQMAIVSVTSVASIRDLAAPAASLSDDQILQGNEVPPGAQYATAIPPLADSFQRGGAPQFKITFGNGSRVPAVVYCDANTAIAMPARYVDVAVISPPVLAAARDQSVEVPSGLILEALTACHVSWGMRPASEAPLGPATYTQAAHNEDPVQPIIFERPPFAKYVTVIPPATVGAVVRFLSGTTTVIATPPPIATQNQARLPVPYPATHVQVDVAPGSAFGNFVYCVWHLGC